jgi:hypothetical protein
MVRHCFPLICPTATGYYAQPVPSRSISPGAFHPERCDEFSAEQRKTGGRERKNPYVTIVYGPFPRGRKSALPQAQGLGFLPRGRRRKRRPPFARDVAAAKDVGASRPLPGSDLFFEFE